jgi:predicted enzyme related to lactoylglutathione lyase
MSNLPPTCLVLFVDDVAKLTAFYSNVANMAIRHQDSAYAVMGIDGFELILHAMQTESPPIIATSHITVREDSYFKLCLPVSDIAAARATAKAFGGAIKAIEHEWVFQGIRACDGHDPEGNVIQLRMLVS